MDALLPLFWADALPLWFVFTFGGCFAAGDLGAATEAVQPLCCWVSFCRFGCGGGVGFFGLWVELVVFPMLLAAVRVVAVFSHLCVRFFCVSLFLVLCVLVLVELYLGASRLCL